MERAGGVASRHPSNSVVQTAVLGEQNGRGWNLTPTPGSEEELLLTIGVAPKEVPALHEAIISHIAWLQSDPVLAQALGEQICLLERCQARLIEQTHFGMGALPHGYVQALELESRRADGQ